MLVYTVQLQEHKPLCIKICVIFFNSGQKRSKFNQNSNVICSEQCQCNCISSQMSVNVGQCITNKKKGCSTLQRSLWFIPAAVLKLFTIITQKNQNVHKVWGLRDIKVYSGLSLAGPQTISLGDSIESQIYMKWKCGTQTTLLNTYMNVCCTVWHFCYFEIFSCLLTTLHWEVLCERWMWKIMIQFPDFKHTVIQNRVLADNNLWT
jgi:hypothetical protein